MQSDAKILKWSETIQCTKYNHTLAQQFSVLMLLLMPSAVLLKGYFSKICGLAQESAWAGAYQNIKPNIINKLLVIMNNTLPPPLRRTAVLLYWKLNSMNFRSQGTEGFGLPVGMAVLGQPRRSPSDLWQFSVGQRSLQGRQSPSGIAFFLVGWVRGPMTWGSCNPELPRPPASECSTSL